MYLAFESFHEEVEAQLQRVAAICQKHGGGPLGDAAARRFWAERHEPAERYLREREEDPNGIARAQRRWTSAYLNVGLPVSAIREFRRQAAQALIPYRLVVKDAGLWGMPELFSVRFEHQAPGDRQAADEVDAGADLGLRLAQELGGSMEYCHGVGLRLAHLLPGELGSGLEALRRVKRALDPQGLLNPGKLGL
jgi:FAD/FMN-containing dehydrogenase